ncbi:hypothetical protein H6P81_000062 [Aristolochia fimbriata]|uniref:Tetrapyrrole biosynthesis uroporphyrinogen III synthase domain-containing protein n=1 Tax=Aristolochia fimbriata TaxID=158543 RepID=A0AAV7F4B1_ARIFI|nr:hypothetical protein H6P81_000062 [Aristolochia fimbriata]
MMITMPARVAAAAAAVSQKPDAGGASVPRRIAFTTPLTYAARIARTIELRGWEPYHCPTISVGPTPRTHSALEPYLLPPDPILRLFSAVAFTSRNGIAAFADSLRPGFPPLPPSSGEVFTVSALGNDAELLDDAFLFGLCPDPSRLEVLVPPVATPAGLVQYLGPGSGRKILCPVPLVVALEEPPVVPDFLDGLMRNGWDPVRVPAYETSWAGPESAEALLEVAEILDAVVFTSSAEVEGLLKGLKELGFCEWEKLRQRWPELVVAAHGPVTAAGAARLGVVVDVVSRRFGSFEGVMEVLERTWGKSE